MYFEKQLKNIWSISIFFKDKNLSFGFYLLLFIATLVFILSFWLIQFSY